MPQRKILPCVLVPVLAASFAAAQEPAPPAAADSARVYELAEVETVPAPANVPALRAALDAGFPPARFQAGTGATVVVSMIVAPDGSVRQPVVVSSTDSAFDAPSLGAVAVLRFTPGTVGGAPVATRVTLPIQWQAPAPETRPDVAGEGVVTSAREEGGERVYTMSEVVARTYDLADVEEEPRPLNIADLRRTMERLYPPALTNENRSGIVQVRFRVLEDGTPEQFSIVHSTDPGLNQVTIQAVSILRFSPARLNGRPVKVWVELPIAWTVH